MPTPYRIHKIAPLRRGSAGITRPDSCTMNGFLKYDGPESRHCVYNEYVALRLAQALRVPVADGVLAVAGDGLAYASLEVAMPGIDLPDMIARQAARVASQYPRGAAALVAFDIWIGNWDRGRNLKASVASPHLPLFLAFDHSHALLDIKADAGESVACLAGGALIAASHPFYGLVESENLGGWVSRIAGLDAGLLADCCVFHRPFRSVDVGLQKSLGNALASRAASLSGIIAENKAKVFATP